MSSVRWLHSPLGVTNASSAIQLRPRDAAKFGSLFLNGGRWYGTQVVPQAWVERSAQSPTAIRGEGYGWLWWKSYFNVRGAAAAGHVRIRQRRQLHLRAAERAPGRGDHGVKLQPQRSFAWASSATRSCRRFSKPGSHCTV